MAERVLITGARAPAALVVARSFQAAGFEPHLADSCPAWMARASRAAARVHAYAAPRTDPAGFARDVARLVETLDPVLFAPTCEEVFHLAPVAEAGGWGDRFFAPSPSVLVGLHSKHRFAETCAWLAVPSPRTVRVTDPAGLRAATPEPERCVVKREFSRFGVQALVGPSRAQLDRLQPSPAQSWVVQDRIAGEEVSFYAVCVDGRLTAFSAYRSTWRLRGGAGYAFEALSGDLMARLRGHAEVLAREVVGRGQFACDAIVDADGEAWLIECNPRSTSGVFLFARPDALAAAMLGREADDALIPACDVRPAMWRYGLPEALRRREFAAWSRQLKAGRDVIGAPGDRAPVLGAILDSLVFARRARRTGQSLEGAMTADIEWNGEPV